MKKKLISMLLCICLATALLAGCGSGKTEKTDNSDQSEQLQSSAKAHVDTLRIGAIYKNNTFSAYSQNDFYGRMNYNGLSQLNFWRRDEKNQLTGDGCFFKSWEISEDNTQLTLHFDPLGNLYFHDGKPVTIDDVVYSFEFYKAQNSTWFLKISNIEVLNDTSIRLTFDSNYAFSFMNEVTVSYYILSKTIWEKVENPKDFTGQEAAVGCGPYKLISVDHDAQISYYEAVENYPIGEITVDKVELHSFDNQASMLQALMNNEIDATYGYSAPIDSTLIPTIANNDEIDIGESLNTSAYHIVFGFNKYPTNDLPFRQAVRYALDYELLRGAIAGDNYGQIANEGAVSPACLGYLDTLPINGQNKDKAVDILNTAGYVDVNGDGFRELPDGTEMEVKIALQSGNDLYKRIAEIMQINLQDIGVRLSVDEETVANTDYTEKLRNESAYEIYIGMTTSGRAQWTGVVNYVADIMSNKKWGTYDDEDYLAAYNGMLYAGSYDEYIENFQKAQTINSEQVPVICLAISSAFYPYRTDQITGWTNYPAWGVINGATWYEAAANN